MYATVPSIFYVGSGDQTQVCILGEYTLCLPGSLANTLKILSTQYTIKD